MKVTIASAKAPVSAFGASCVVSERLIFHGGCTTSSDQPSNQIAILDLDSQTWQVDNSGPHRSYHGCFSTEDRYVHFVGGWDGSKRCHSVDTYDVRSSEWLGPQKIRGFPEGGGLSSHTVTQTAKGALVIGRLGGLRTQRCNSMALLLSGDVRRGFEYRELPITISSRGGHTATVLSATKLALYGGRADPFTGIEVLMFKELKYSAAEEILDFKSHGIPPFVQTSWNISLGDISSKTNVEGKNLKGRRNHVGCALKDGSVFLHGGELFGKMMIGKDCVTNDAWIIDSKKQRWKLPNDFPSLSGHSVHAIGKGRTKLAFVGGIAAPNTINTSVYIYSL